MAKILIVEDDKIILNMYRVKFTKAMHEVQISENGADALKLMKSFNPDIVLMDLMMPVMDGFTALKNAKADPAISNIPIIILTNLSQTEDADQTMKNGAAAYMIKSDLTPTQVLEKVENFLDSSKRS
ncbi:MAG: response regulator [bacterium]|nr:response regulator [bacterium]